MIHARATEILPPEDPSNRIQYYVGDHLDSATLLTDAAGNALEETAFLPFGQPRRQTGPANNAADYAFCQKERDLAGDDLHYFEARYLLSRLGRFNRVDPAASPRPASGL